MTNHAQDVWTPTTCDVLEKCNDLSSACMLLLVSVGVRRTTAAPPTFLCTRYGHPRPHFCCGAFACCVFCFFEYKKSQVGAAGPPRLQRRIQRGFKYKFPNAASNRDLETCDEKFAPEQLRPSAAMITETLCSWGILGRRLKPEMKSRGPDQGFSWAQNGLLGQWASFKLSLQKIFGAGSRRVSKSISGLKHRPPPKVGWCVRT